MVILKFGGTSVNTQRSLETIGKIVIKNRNNQPVIVVSAIQGVTDLLLALMDASITIRSTSLKKIKHFHLKLIKQIWSAKKDQNIHSDYILKLVNDIDLILKSSPSTPELQDRVASYGEIMSSYIVSQALTTWGVSTKQIIASDFIVTNDNFGLAEFYPGQTKRKVISALKPLIEHGMVPVVTGFIGATQSGKTTTLGRGGSDYTAAILGYCLGATEIQIWTDVSGIYSADPKIVKNAKVLKNISYGLAKTLAESGAKVLYPKTIEPAILNKIPIRVLNTFSPDSSGTSIIHNNQMITKNIICGITYRKFRLNKIIVSVVGLNLDTALLQKVSNFLSNFSKQNVHLYDRNNYGYQFLIESNNPNEIIAALHNKYIA